MDALGLEVMDLQVRHGRLHDQAILFLLRGLPEIV